MIDKYTKKLQDQIDQLKRGYTAMNKDITKIMEILFALKLIEKETELRLEKNGDTDQT